MSNLVKYPRTMHCPWSESGTSDDVWLKNCDHFKGKEVVMTLKMDGEGTSLYRDHIHARSLDSKNHYSRNWVKGLWGEIKHEIPENMRLCGENLFAFHSILYSGLPSYFFCFGIYDGDNNCLSWDDTVAICQMLKLETVPVLYRGIWDEKLIRSLWTGKGPFPTFSSTDYDNPQYPDTFISTDNEGYVVRTVEAFPYDTFKDNVFKWVRKNHVQTSQHWMNQAIIRNLLAEGLV